MPKHCPLVFVLCMQILQLLSIRSFLINRAPRLTDYRESRLLLLLFCRVDRYRANCRLLQRIRKTRRLGDKCVCCLQSADYRLGKAVPIVLLPRDGHTSHWSPLAHNALAHSHCLTVLIIAIEWRWLFSAVKFKFCVVVCFEGKCSRKVDDA